MARQIDEPTGLNAWSVAIEGLEDGKVQLQIIGPKGGHKDFVVILKQALLNAVIEECRDSK